MLVYGGQVCQVLLLLGLKGSTCKNTHTHNIKRCLTPMPRTNIWHEHERPLSGRPHQTLSFRLFDMSVHVGGGSKRLIHSLIQT